MPDDGLDPSEISASNATASPGENLRGPYDTEQQARDALTARGASPQPGRIAEANRRNLDDALAEARLTLGRWDEQVCDWFAGFEPATVEAVASLIRRRGTLLTPAQRWEASAARMYLESLADMDEDERVSAPVVQFLAGHLRAALDSAGCTAVPVLTAGQQETVGRARSWFATHAVEYPVTGVQASDVAGQLLNVIRELAGGER
jgi:hypothetical protein